MDCPLYLVRDWNNLQLVLFLTNFERMGSMLRWVICLSMILGVIGCNKITYDMTEAKKDPRNNKFQQNVQYTVEVNNNTSPVRD